jgi:hypothetical protein
LMSLDSLVQKDSSFSAFSDPIVQFFHSKPNDHSQTDSDATTSGRVEIWNSFHNFPDLGKNWRNISGSRSMSLLNLHINMISVRQSIIGHSMNRPTFEWCQTMRETKAGDGLVARRVRVELYRVCSI